MIDVVYKGTPEQREEIFIGKNNNKFWLDANWLFEKSMLFGDLDGSETVTAADAIYLLYHTLFGEARYPVSQPVDFTGDGNVNAEDAIYLLYHTLFGAERYPLAAAPAKQALPQ